MLLTISYSESANPIIPVEPLKSRFSDYSEIAYNLFLKTTIMYHMLWTISYSESPCPSVELLKASLYDYFGISEYFASRYIHTKQP